MKIERFNEANSNSGHKFYVFSVSPYDQTYRGSIWDSPQKPWVPFGAELVAEFELKDQNYMVVSQEDLDEINKIKEDIKMKRDAKKYNI